jgi:hypothetical protein
MKLKGAYNSGTTYDVGDVVRFDSVAYHLQHPCPAGTPPVDTRYWGRTSQTINNIVDLCMDAIALADGNDLTLANNLTTETTGKALDATQGKALKDALDTLNIPDNISDDAIVLNSSTASSTKQFIITVDDDGELTATEVTPTEAEETQEGGES